MANIPLRAYMLEIEGLIDSGQLEETVSHCRYILQLFPKHIDTYRLLGKVFLEGKQFSNAADILQRVLSAVPNDFVSHVGMSIIREDEGNLDAAIWHMERAFESQPANKAIQDELRRLFGRRDGVEPPKIRLTRGALAGMYAKGNLYDQAIAELRGALSEDPQRPDLLMLLAQMSYLSGNRVEAVEASSNILKKFPYCLIANRILALILPQTERSEDAKVYQHRAFALDPYLTKAGVDALTSEDVPDSAITVEPLVRKPGQPVEGLTEQPAWATSLGIKLEETEDKDLPDWLTEDLTVPSYEGAQIAPFVEEEMEKSEAEVESEGEVIPGWMKEAGWQPSLDETEGQPSGEGIGEASEVEGEIEKAEIPDWLKEIATVEEMEEETTIEAISEDALPPWLDETPPGPTDSIISWLGDRDEESQVLGTEATEESTDEIEVPSWLNELGGEKELDTELPSEIAAPSIAELESSEAQEAEGADELPEWLIESTDQVGSISAETDESVEPITTEPTEERLEFIGDLTEEEIEESQGIPEFLQESETELTQATSPEELIVEKLESTDKAVTELSDEEIEIPDWLKSLDEEIESEPLFEETPGEPTEIPVWLQELGKSAEEIELSDKPTTESTSELSVEQEEIITPEIHDQQEMISGQAGEIDQDMQDSALAWLESLAAKQGVSEDELITKPEDRLESPPEWILEEELGADIEAEVASTEIEELPDWLQELKQTEEETKTEALPIEQAEETVELPAWLRELEPEEPEGLELVDVDEGDVEKEVSDDDSGLAWLESLAEKQGASEEELITRPEDRTTEPPSWVNEEVKDLEKPGEISIEEEPSQESQVEAPASDELQAWMTEPQDQDISIGEEIDISSEVPVEPEIKVDLNTGSLVELESITGVGFVLAQNIIDYREEHGPFRDYEDLREVPGIDDYSFEFIKDRLILQPSVEIPRVEVTTESPEWAENEQLIKARNAFEVGDYDGESEAYEQLIKQSQNLKEVISLLEAEISQKPDNIVLWQSLGDAYMHDDQFQKALEAYTKAETLL